MRKFFFIYIFLFSVSFVSVQAVHQNTPLESYAAYCFLVLEKRIGIGPKNVSISRGLHDSLELLREITYALQKKTINPILQKYKAPFFVTGSSFAGHKNMLGHDDEDEATSALFVLKESVFRLKQSLEGVKTEGDDLYIQTLRKMKQFTKLFDDHVFDDRNNQFLEEMYREWREESQKKPFWLWTSTKIAAGACVTAGLCWLLWRNSDSKPNEKDVKSDKDNVVQKQALPKGSNESRKDKVVEPIFPKKSRQREVLEPDLVCGHEDGVHESFLSSLEPVYQLDQGDMVSKHAENGCFMCCEQCCDAVGEGKKPFPLSNQQVKVFWECFLELAEIKQEAHYQEAIVANGYNEAG